MYVIVHRVTLRNVLTNQCWLLGSRPSAKRPALHFTAHAYLPGSHRFPTYVLSHHIAAAADSRCDLPVSDAKLICFDEAVLGICCRLCACWLPNLTGSLNAGVHGSTSVRLSPMTPVGNDTPGAMVTEKRLPAQR